MSTEFGEFFIVCASEFSGEALGDILLLALPDEDVIEIPGLHVSSEYLSIFVRLSI